MPTPIYLDHAATTPLAPEVLAAMHPYLENEFANPSTLYQSGLACRKAIDSARQTVAECLGATAEQIVFTGSGTEANNLAILGVTRAITQTPGHIITSQIEHPAVLEPCRALEQQGWQVTYLPVNGEGFVSPDDLTAAIRPDTVLVSIMYGNNEVGALQPIAALGRICREHGAAFHTDAVQVAGKLPIDLSILPVDYLTVSSHKVYGPKGLGAFFIRENATKPTPLIYGGGQEHGLRSGTENVAAIVGFAQGLELCCQEMDPERQRLLPLQEKFITSLTQCAQDLGIPLTLNGPQNMTDRVPGNINVSFDGMTGEAMVVKLDLYGISVSSGSACHSAVIEPSHVLKAMGQSDEVALGTVRFSMGRRTTWEDLDRVVQVLPKILKTPALKR
ncbi:MAG: cysteine desulfurase [Vampirovibrio sp.]|nr:cysteine desulfurase [Vampirovibrio sp.]